MALNNQRIGEHLQEDNRDNLSALIMIGSWIEILYFSCSIESKKHNKVIHNHIGEQIITLNQIIILLKNYESDTKIKFLRDELVLLHKLCKNVKVIIIEKPSKITKKDGLITIERENEAITTISPKDFTVIFAKISKIRSDIVAK